MRIYLASRYSRRLELCGYRQQLRELGHDVRARWLDGGHQISDGGEPIGEHGERLVEGDDGSQSQRAAELRSKFAMDDLMDVAGADCVISFTEPPRSNASRGGRHVEMGIALGIHLISEAARNRSSPRLIVVGYRENIFHWLPCVQFYEDWTACFDQLQHEDKLRTLKAS